MQLTYCDDHARYRIDCPPGAEVKRGEGDIDFLVVPDPDEPQQPYWLFEEKFGLRLVSVDPIN